MKHFMYTLIPYILYIIGALIPMVRAWYKSFPGNRTKSTLESPLFLVAISLSALGRLAMYASEHPELKGDSAALLFILGTQLFIATILYCAINAAAAILFNFLHEEEHLYDIYEDIYEDLDATRNDIKDMRKKMKKMSKVIEEKINTQEKEVP